MGRGQDGIVLLNKVITEHFDSQDNAAMLILRAKIHFRSKNVRRFIPILFWFVYIFIYKLINNITTRSYSYPNAIWTSSELLKWTTSTMRA